MPDKNFQDMDKKEKQPEKGMDTTNIVPSSQGPSPSTQPPSTTSRSEPNTEQAPDPDHPVHCQSCGLEYYYVGGLSHNHLKDWKPEPKNDTRKDKKMDHGQPSSRFATSDDTNKDEMNHGLPSPRYTTFSGVTLDQALPGQISAFHFLENDGDRLHWSEEWDTVANKVGGLERLQQFLRIGLAAVRVKVENNHLSGENAQTTHLSGFRLSRDLVVTCAHFTEWEGGNDVEHYLTEKNGQCHAIQAQDVAGDNHVNRFVLRLHAIHKEWDIAIFRITCRPQNDHKNVVVEVSDLYLDTPQGRGSLSNASQMPYWSVGYNVVQDMEEFKTVFGMFFNRRQDREKARIRQDYNFSADNPPESTFLKQDRRTVSFGTHIGHAENAKPYQKCVELSAWHGRSGSMVCTVIGGKARIIGMIQGGNPESDCNHFVLLNTEMQQWLNAATAPCVNADQQEKNRRIVMK
ncbi:hypothetical protein H2204_009776 [Knufia peltigerae]|uniref:Uncharacterized protein n=1 Tax=Knufia peltigerae TaxID=1002370 RepID=A0AA38XXB6_9EURO|nr:hypothetical protein H2204_009776 [Knufia peltigerae]